MYQKILSFARHRSAPVYLAALAFAESSFFRVPPDVLLCPMVFANRQRAWYYAILTTFAAVIGGVVGYAIGEFFFHLLYPYIVKFGYAELYQQIITWFRNWGSWTLIVASFTPIPYRSFTIVAGALHMPIIPFVVAIFFGRAVRYFTLAGVIVLGGNRAERFLQRYVDWVGWLFVALLLIGTVTAIFLYINHQVLR